MPKFLVGPEVKQVILQALHLCNRELISNCSKNSDGEDNQLCFCLRKKPWINSVRVNCVLHELYKLF